MEESLEIQTHCFYCDTELSIPFEGDEKAYCKECYKITKDGKFCSNCDAFTHRRCQVLASDGEQCWMVEGHENSDCKGDRRHWALRCGNILTS